MKRITLNVILMLVLVLSLFAGQAMASEGYNKMWGNWLNDLLPKYFNGVQGNVEQPVTSVETEENIVFAPVESSQSELTTDEAMMIEKVNAERVQRGLRPLEVDMRLVRLARIKAKDMIDNNYFDHQSPILGSPFDQMREAGVKYALAGENLAGARNVDEAHRGLMNSPGHRANILKDQYTHIGIGVIDGGPYGKMFVQHFIQIR